MSSGFAGIVPSQQRQSGHTTATGTLRQQHEPKAEHCLLAAGGRVAFVSAGTVKYVSVAQHEGFGVDVLPRIYQIDGTYVPSVLPGSCCICAQWHPCSWRSTQANINNMVCMCS